MMRRKLVTLLGVALMWLGAPAHAQNEPGFYLGIEGGFYSVEDQTDEVAHAYLDLFGGSVRVEQSNGGVGRLFGGYAFNPNLAVEFAFLSGNESLEVDGYDDWGNPYSVSGAYSWNGPEVSVRWRPLGTGFFLRAGFNSLGTETKVKFSGVGYPSITTTESGSSKIGTSFGLGYDLALGEGLRHHVRFAYTSINNEAVNEEDALDVFSIGYYYAF